jgi:hypothetical protein
VKLHGTRLIPCETGCDRLFRSRPALGHRCSGEGRNSDLAHEGLPTPATHSKTTRKDGSSLKTRSKSKMEDKNERSRVDGDPFRRSRRGVVATASRVPQIYWPGTRREPGAQFKRFIVNTPIAEGVVFRPAAAAEPQGLWCGRCGAMQVSSRAHIRWGTLTPTMDVSQIAVRAQYPSFIPDYPLAPEASIPVTTPRTGGHLSRSSNIERHLIPS